MLTEERQEVETNPGPDNHEPRAGRQQPPQVTRTTTMTNNFSLGSQVGGPDAGEATRQHEQKLRDAFNSWQGDYTDAIREFAFILRVDGKIHTYTQKWNILGAQPAKRKKDWIEVEISVPENWWREDQGRNYKIYLTAAIEKGLKSMLELLQHNKHVVKAEALLGDWERIKSNYLHNDLSGMKPN